MQVLDQGKDYCTVLIQGQKIRTPARVGKGITELDGKYRRMQKKYIELTEAHDCITKGMDGEGTCKK